jgi:hypothetical protein
MKIIFIILSLGLLFSCNPSNPQPQDVNWKFEFTLNGVTHKAQGAGVSPNKNSTFSTGLTQVYIAIKDQSDPSYISGNNGDLVIQFLNPNVGLQSLDKCKTYGSWWTDLEQNGINVFNGYSLTSGGAQVANSNGGLGPALPINITSLGIAGDGNWLGGTVFKGNYNGTLYFPSLNSTTWPIQYNIPVSVNLNFEAVRQ